MLRKSRNVEDDISLSGSGEDASGAGRRASHSRRTETHRAFNEDECRKIEKNIPRVFPRRTGEARIECLNLFPFPLGKEGLGVRSHASALNPDS